MSRPALPPRALTEREADFLRRIAKGEDPGARIEGESSLLTASRRRTVAALRRKGALMPIRKRTNIVGRQVDVREVPRLTDKGRQLISGAP